MKNMKILALSILFSIVWSNNLQAQEKTVTKEQKQEIVNQYKENQERLALTVEQQEPYKVIAKKYAKKMRDLRESAIEKPQKLEALKSIITDKNAEMKTLLSDEQYKIYLDIQEERKAKMQAIISK